MTLERHNYSKKAFIIENTKTKNATVGKKYKILVQLKQKGVTVTK